MSPLLRLPGAAASWWLRELAGMVPESLRHSLSGRGGRLVLAIDARGAAQALYASGGRHETLGALDGSAGSVAALRRLLEQPRWRRRIAGAAVAIELPAALALRTTTTLPAAAEGSLREVLSFDLDRRTPFKSADVYFDGRVAARDAKAGLLQVELAVVAREWIDGALALARELGLEVERVELRAEDAEEPLPHNLLPPKARPARRRTGDLLLAGLAAVTLLLAAAAVGIPVYRAHEAAAALAEEVAQAKRAAAATAVVQKEIETARQEESMLAERKRHEPAVSETLFLLTHLLPDDAWLSDLRISGAEVQLLGIAASASDLIGLLDRSKRFADASFRASLTQDQRLKRERFNIGARIAPAGGG
ncbi:MAG TPA: PilN domain-containing protein [Stellaceae bacterium]|nr:PilN domain-containing protein [Stellaceae bacterium]